MKGFKKGHLKYKFHFDQAKEDLITAILCVKLEYYVPMTGRGC